LGLAPFEYDNHAIFSRDTPEAHPHIATCLFVDRSVPGHTQSSRDVKRRSRVSIGMRPLSSGIGTDPVMGVSLHRVALLLLFLLHTPQSLGSLAETLARRTSDPNHSVQVSYKVYPCYSKWNGEWPPKVVSLSNEYGVLRICVQVY